MTPEGVRADFVGGTALVNIWTNNTTLLKETVLAVQTFHLATTHANIEVTRVCIL